MIDKKLTSDVSEDDDDDAKSGPPATLDGTDTLRKYLTKSDVNDTVLTALSSIARGVEGSA
jgi:hypothetical protein